MTHRPVDVARAFVEAFGRRDMAAVARYVADDIAFESPRAKANGAEGFLEAAGQFAQIVTRIDVIAAFGDNERALIMYDMETGPFGTLRAADHLVIRDGRIHEDTLVFDTYEVRMAETR